MFSRILHFRVSRAPRLPLPYGIRSVGHYTTPPDLPIDRRFRKPFVQLFWAAAGYGYFLYEEKPLRVRANEVFVYAAGSEHELTAGPDGFEYHWFTLDGPLADPVVKSFGLTAPWPRYAGPPPVKLFARLTEQLKDVSLFAEKDATATGYALLLLASDAGLRPPTQGASDALTEAVRQRLLDSVADPQFAVEALAGEFSVHRSLLSRTFRKSFGLSPKQFLQSLRIHRAMSLLRTTPQSVRQIARQVGFEDASYFARAFRQHTGNSPEQFRLSG
jgi:AraC-like DNA-binding protein